MIKILVVDDSKAIRDLLSNMLSSMGFHVAVASNGNEGLHLFLTNSFDLVLSVQMLPQSEGRSKRARLWERPWGPGSWPIHREVCWTEPQI